MGVLLSGGLSRVFAAAFSGVYMPAKLYRSDRTYDEGGSITDDFKPKDIRAQRDSVTKAMREEPGYGSRDVAIIVLVDPARGPVDIGTDDQVLVQGARYKIASATLDAASSHWVCRATPA